MTSYPLTPFDALMLEIDRPERPMVFFVRLHFDGRFNPDSFKRAAARSLSLHPFVNSLVEGPPARPAFRPGSAAPITVLAGEPPPMSYLPMDLRTGPGLTVRVTVGERSSALDVQIHHAVCDGRAALGLLRDFLIEYDRERGASVDPPTRDFSMLAQRGAMGMTWKSLLLVGPMQPIGLIGIRRALMRSPLRLSSRAEGPRDAPTEALEAPRMIGHVFEVEETERISAAAHAKGATQNSLLLTRIYETVETWERGRGTGSGRDWVRVAVPFDLRTLDMMLRLPAANVTSLVFLDRRREEAANREKLLVSLRNEVGFIKAWRLALTFVMSLWVARRLGLRSDSIRLGATAMATNLGRVTGDAQKAVAGGVALDRVEVYAPLLPDTPLSFTFYQYAGRLNVTLRWDPEVLGEKDAAGLFALFIEGLKGGKA